MSAPWVAGLPLKCDLRIEMHRGYLLSQRLPPLYKKRLRLLNHATCSGTSQGLYSSTAVHFSPNGLSKLKRPWRDSNSPFRLRRPTLYPLSYRGKRRRFYHKAEGRWRSEGPLGGWMLPPPFPDVLSHCCTNRANRANRFSLRPHLRRQSRQFAPQRLHERRIASLVSESQQLLLLMRQFSADLIETRCFRAALKEGDAHSERR